jgi:serine/threonine protein kinase/serine/threonine protein phosphatase PrpC
MASALRVSVGQHSDKGRKAVNQDFYGVFVPQEPLLTSKGIAVAMADGIGSSEVSQVASEFAVMSFLDDYYCTSEAWSVKKSVMRVLAATNSWLHSRTHQSQYRYERDRGYVCTLGALVVKAGTAHVFHVGDTRVWQLQGNRLEQLTEDHRICVSPSESYLSRAVGAHPQVEIDYRAVAIDRGDVFVLTTDGVHEHVDAPFIVDAIHDGRDDLDAVAQRIVDEALQRGSTDNLTVQIVAIDGVPAPGSDSVHPHLSELALPPLLDARMSFEGYRILRELSGSSRSHIYLAVDGETDELTVLKTPSIDLQGDRKYLERFSTEEWIARRINSPHVVKPCRQSRKRHYLYVAMEYIEGQTLTQWMTDNPRPDLETVRGIVEQIGKGLGAFHRLEMLHQDLRPDNVMIDRNGTVRIIDFGAARVAGIAEMATPGERSDILGTAQYTAPEYFLGEPGTQRSDLFSLGVIAYQMLSGRLPYGAEIAKRRTRAAQRRLRYASVLDAEREIPAWIDEVLKRAVHLEPFRRQEAVSAFLHDLRHPSSEYLAPLTPPLIERRPVLFWKSVSGVLLLIVLLLVFGRFGVPHREDVRPPYDVRRETSSGAAGVERVATMVARHGARFAGHVGGSGQGAGAAPAGDRRGERSSAGEVPAQ